MVVVCNTAARAWRERDWTRARSWIGVRRPPPPSSTPRSRPRDDFGRARGLDVVVVCDPIHERIDDDPDATAGRLSLSTRRRPRPTRPSAHNGARHLTPVLDLRGPRRRPWTHPRSRHRRPPRRRHLPPTPSAPPTRQGSRSPLGAYLDVTVPFFARAFARLIGDSSDFRFPASDSRETPHRRRVERVGPLRLNRRR